jgi:predicted 3-demethylubiquinone-9 3-methyltransferase (glyoxalase superfamily)
MQDLHPCLWFDTCTEQAAELYASLFPSSRLGRKAFYGKAAAKESGQPEGSLLTLEFDLADQHILGLNGGSMFRFTPALSFFVHCQTEAEIDRLWQGLSAGGKELMALDRYPWATKFGWTADRFGVQWQLMLSDTPRAMIAPAFLFVKELFGRGQEALDFWQGIFPNSRTDFVARDDATGTIQHAAFTLNGRPFVLMEGQGPHDFTFNEAFSLVVPCDTQAEIDRVWAALTDGGSESQCGWLKDRFGVSWQVAPSETGTWLSDPERSDAVMAEVVTMKKLDLARMEKAYRGG